MSSPARDMSLSFHEDVSENFDTDLPPPPNDEFTEGEQQDSAPTVPDLPTLPPNELDYFYGAPGQEILQSDADAGGEAAEDDQRADEPGRAPEEYLQGGYPRTPARVRSAGRGGGTPAGASSNANAAFPSSSTGLRSMAADSDDSEWLPDEVSGETPIRHRGRSQPTSASQIRPDGGSDFPPDGTPAPRAFRTDVRPPRVRQRLRSSSRHQVWPLNEPVPHRPEHLQEGGESGRNMLARFGSEDATPRTISRLRIDRGRTGSLMFPGYPAGNTELPARLSLQDIAERYPNHVWGTGLRLFMRERWSAEEIWRTLPGDGRQNKAHARMWNYLQQAIGRETDRIQVEETGWRRVPIKRRNQGRTPNPTASHDEDDRKKKQPKMSPSRSSTLRPGTRGIHPRLHNQTRLPSQAPANPAPSGPRLQAPTNSTQTSIPVLARIPVPVQGTMAAVTPQGLIGAGLNVAQLNRMVDGYRSEIIPTVIQILQLQDLRFGNAGQQQQAVAQAVAQAEDHAAAGWVNGLNHRHANVSLPPGSTWFQTLVEVVRSIQNRNPNGQHDDANVVARRWYATWLQDRAQQLGAGLQNLRNPQSRLPPGFGTGMGHPPANYFLQPPPSAHHGYGPMVAPNSTPSRLPRVARQNNRPRLAPRQPPHTFQDDFGGPQGTVPRAPEQPYSEPHSSNTPSRAVWGETHTTSHSDEQQYPAGPQHVFGTNNFPPRSGSNDFRSGNTGLDFNPSMARPSSSWVQRSSFSRPTTIPPHTGQSIPSQYVPGPRRGGDVFGATTRRNASDPYQPEDDAAVFGGIRLRSPESVQGAQEADDDDDDDDDDDNEFDAFGQEAR